jgi:hypothetical protein
MSIPQHIIQALIDLGAPEGAPDERALLDVLDPYARAAHNHNPNGEWRRLAASMEPEALRCMIRGVVLAEEKGKWYGGSVSIVITLYRAYQDKRIPDEEELTNWVMRTSRNEYAPFGRNRGGARSLAELREQNAREYVRKEAAAVEEKRRAEEGARKKKEATERHVVRMQAQKEAVGARHELVENFVAMPLAVRVRTIVEDIERPFGYYAPDMLVGDLATSVSLDPDVWQALADRIASSRDRRWKRWLKEHLAGLLDR